MSIRKIVYTSLILSLTHLIFCGEAAAIVNIEKMRKDSGEKGFSSSLSFTLSYIEGNTDVTSHKTTLRSDYAAERFRTFLVLSHQRGEKDDVRHLNKGFIHLRGIKPMTERYAVEGFLQKGYNDFTLLEDRRLIGTGIRTVLVEEEEDDRSLGLYFGVGLMREREVIDYPPEEISTITRSTNYLSCRWQASEGTRFSGTLYYQPRFSDTGDYRILFDGGFAFALTKRIDFTFSVNYRHDNRPPIGIRNYDVEITNGFSLSF